MLRGAAWNLYGAPVEKLLILPLFAAEPVSSFAPCCLNLKEESSTGLLLQNKKQIKQKKNTDATFLQSTLNLPPPPPPFLAFSFQSPFYCKPVTSIRLWFSLFIPFLCTASNFAKLDVDTFLSLFLFPHSLFSHYLKKPLGESASIVCVRRV